MNFQQLSKKIDTVKKDLPNMMDRAVFENQSEMIDLNTAQLSKGKNSLDELLDRYASDTYSQFKQAMGSQAPNGIADLKLEGDFYSGFTLSKDGEDYIIYSTDEKADSLVFRYGESIFGLTEQSVKVLKPNLLSSFLTELRNKLL